MVNNVPKLSENAAGRPPIKDELTLYIYLEVARSNNPMSLHKLTSRRGFRFNGYLYLNGRTFKPARPPISDGTLRRRFYKARAALGLWELPPGFTCEAHEQLQLEIRTTLKRLVADLAD